MTKLTKEQNTLRVIALQFRHIYFDEMTGLERNILDALDKYGIQPVVDSEAIVSFKFPWENSNVD